MCGICGQYNLDGQPVYPDRVQEMAEAIRHRGPDSGGFLARGNIGLGHRRLSIIDVSENGNQPMVNSDGTTWIVFNGEIYNYLALRQACEADGHRFRSHSDTEVILALYERHGVGLLRQLEGMFAFAIWDSRERELILARDRIGIKPLYYCFNGRSLVFGSEIKAMLQSDEVPREVSSAALVTYVTFGHSFAPDTVYKNVKKVLPGHYLVAGRDSIRDEQYWDITDTVSDQSISEARAIEEVRWRLEEAVRSHMVSDVPVGAFLSGGIDSSAAVAFMSKYSTEPVKTFAIGFDVGGYYNELDDARKVARQFNTDHREKTVTQDDALALVEKLVYQYDEPFADAASLPTYLVSQFAREHVKVVLSGEGGDEVFGGYNRYYAHALNHACCKIPSVVRSGVVPLSKALARIRMQRAIEVRRRIRKFLDTMALNDEAVRYARLFAPFPEDVRETVMSDDVAAQAAEFDELGVFRRYYNAFPQWDPINRALYTDLKGWLPDMFLEKMDKASMAVSLEGRVPFLDHRLVEYVFTLPGRLKVRGKTLKYILKKSLEGTLLDATINKPKHGFAVPVHDWFRGRLRKMTEEVLLDPSQSRCEYLNREKVQNIVTEHMTNRGNHGWQLWTLLNLALWHRVYVQPGRQKAARSEAAMVRP